MPPLHQQHWPECSMWEGDIRRQSWPGVGHPGLERRAGLGRGGRMAARLLEETLGTFVVAAGSQGRGPASGQAAAWL